MAPRLSQSQVCGLFDFLGSHQMVSSLESWRSARVTAEELKVSWNSFRKMRREKVTPKVLGNIRRKDCNDIAPWSLEEDQALSKLIKDTVTNKGRTFVKLNELWSKLISDITPLQED